MPEKKQSNVSRLIAHISSIKAIPPGGDITDGLMVLADKKRFVALMNQSKLEADACIEAVRNTADNPFGDDQEAIAGEILKRIGKNQSYWNLKREIPTEEN